LINLAFFAVSPRKTTATVDARKHGDAQRWREEVATIPTNAGAAGPVTTLRCVSEAQWPSPAWCSGLTVNRERFVEATRR
jgi:hypothetical protein